MTRPLRAAVLCLVLVVLPACTTPAPNQPKAQRIALIVLDDFTHSTETPMQQLVRIRLNIHDNCVYTGMAANDVYAGGGGGPVPGLTHGQGVYRLVRQELAKLTDLTHSPIPPQVQLARALKSFAPVGQPNHIVDVDNWLYGSADISVIAVDTADFSTQQIAEGLGPLIDYLRDQQGFTGFVINMSFVIFPCDVLKWFAQATHDGEVDQAALMTAYQTVINNVPELNDIKSTFNQLAGGANHQPATTTKVPGLERAEPLVPVTLFYTSPHAQQTLQADPLQAFLATPGSRVIPVAAAGNGIFRPATPGSPPPLTVRTILPTQPGNPTYERLEFPLAPAQWASVVSASAEKADGTLADYSNTGEIMMPGDYLDANGKVLATGTSYAAPRLSIHEAIYLLNGGPGSCRASAPPLGYVTDGQAASDNPLVWQNLPYNDETLRTVCAEGKDYFQLRPAPTSGGSPSAATSP